MKIVVLKIGIAILNGIYFFIKLCPIQKNKITFISRQADKASLDFRMLEIELKAQNEHCKIIMLCKTLQNGLLKKIGYCFHMLTQMYHIATSKVVILDSYCIPICILKQKKKLTVIQIWHALGSLKKFGYSTLNKKDGRDSKIAKTMKMHQNYTYILTSSTASAFFFREAFNVKEEQMLIMNLPRVDFLQSQKAKHEIMQCFYEVYPEAKNGKENILYCPTKRKENNIPIETIAKQIPFENYNLIIKLHDGTEIVYIEEQKIQKESHFSGMELLHIGDYIITDYSAICYEAAVSKKPIYFYTYDYEEYMKDRGIYIDYKKEMPGPISKDFKEIIKLIKEKQYDIRKIRGILQ
ncbi:MAG: hypothetical protein HFJ28_03685 [Clostridia bacterium]|nr:hypothetical protein [Clostridia bacterium]